MLCECGLVQAQRRKLKKKEHNGEQAPWQYMHVHRQHAWMTITSAHLQFWTLCNFFSRFISPWTLQPSCRVFGAVMQWHPRTDMFANNFCTFFDELFSPCPYPMLLMAQVNRPPSKVKESFGAPLLSNVVVCILHERHLPPLPLFSYKFLTLFVFWF